jgi:hypothetical protein
MSVALRWRSKRSAGQARDLLYAIVRYGNNYNFDAAAWSDAQVRGAFAARSLDFNKTVLEARNPSAPLPFENLIGSSWEVGDGAKVGAHNMLTGETENEVEGPATFSLHSYWTSFESAVQARDRVVDRNSSQPLGEMLAAGVASVETYLRHRAKIFNDLGGYPPLVDDAQHKVPFDQKLREWVPLTSDGEHLDLGSRHWQDFKALRDLRDNVVIHNKSVSVAWSFRDIANTVNRFRSVAAVLIDLHKLHHEKCPAIVIKAAYAPHLELITLPDRS